MNWDAATRARLRKARRYILLYALLIGLAIAVILPISWIVASSFTTRETVWKNALPFSWRAFFPAGIYAGRLPSDLRKRLRHGAAEYIFSRRGHGRARHRRRRNVGLRLRPPQVPLEELPLRTSCLQFHDPRRLDNHPLIRPGAGSGLAEYLAGAHRSRLGQRHYHLPLPPVLRRDSAGPDRRAPRRRRHLAASLPCASSCPSPNRL